jgi:hypothetical protein
VRPPTPSARSSALAAACAITLLLAGCGGSSSDSSSKLTAACEKARQTYEHEQKVILEQNGFDLYVPAKLAKTLAVISEMTVAAEAAAQSASGETKQQLELYAGALARQHHVLTAAAAHESSVVAQLDPGLNQSLREGVAAFKRVCNVKSVPVSPTGSGGSIPTP